MKNEHTTNKSRLNRLELYKLVLTRLNECQTTKGGIISFPDLFLKICRSFSIDKQRAWRLLFELRDNGYIEIVKTKGVILK